MWTDVRRSRCSGTAVLGLPLCEVVVRGPGLAADLPQPKNRFARMVHEYFVREVEQAYQQHVQDYQQLQTREDAQRYVSSVRDRIRECFGPDPERTPLNPRVTGVVDRDAYRIEKVIFESRPSFPVTANLYVPKNVALPASRGDRDMRSFRRMEKRRPPINRSPRAWPG